MPEQHLSQIKGKNVLITGGCGFIGSEIVKQLSQLEANVTIIDNLSSGKEKYIQGKKHLFYQVVPLQAPVKTPTKKDTSVTITFD